MHHILINFCLTDLQEHGIFQHMCLCQLFFKGSWKVSIVQCSIQRKPFYFLKWSWSNFSFRYKHLAQQTGHGNEEIYQLKDIIWVKESLQQILSNEYSHCATKTYFHIYWVWSSFCELGLPVVTLVLPHYEQSGSFTVNSHWLVRIFSFPLIGSLGFFFRSLWLTRWEVSVYSDWLLWILWFWFLCPIQVPFYLRNLNGTRGVFLTNQTWFFFGFFCQSVIVEALW